MRFYAVSEVRRHLYAMDRGSLPANGGGRNERRHCWGSMTQWRFILVSGVMILLE